MFEDFAQSTKVVEFGDLIISIEWWRFFDIIKYFLMLLTFLFVFAIILIIIRTESGLKIRLKEAVEEAIEVGRLPKNKTQKELDDISFAIESEDQEKYKEAVVMAERLFDRTLKTIGFSGENVEKRIEKIPDNQLEFKEDIIWAYKLKERILSDIDLQIDREEAKRAVYIFQRALKEMNIV